jgi:type III secretion protein J
MQRPMGPLLVCLVLLGCRTQVQHGLDERQANEIQAALTGRGLPARKVLEQAKKPSWAIEVESEAASEATRVLSELGLPRPRLEGITEVFGKGSLVPSATEERALLIQALSGELARTLEAVDGVLSARVHVVLPGAHRPGQPPTPAKASAYLRLRAGASARLGLEREALRALVAGAVEGLSPEAVTLVWSEVEVRAATHPLAAAPIGQGRRVQWVGAGLLLTAVMCVGGAVLLRRSSRSGTEAARERLKTPVERRLS